MSFILDALKKSESERQRQNAPGIASIPASGKGKKSAKWPWLVVGLLAVNLAVLGAIMLKPDAPSVSSSGAETTTGVPASSAPQRSPDIAIEAQSSVPAPAAVPVSGAPQPQPVFEAAAEAPAQRPPTVASGLPTLRELRAAGQMQLPEMHLDIHVYAGRADDRFVFVNMSKYKEGATLNEGPRISEITPEGVVLDYFGTRFLLPRE